MMAMVARNNATAVRGQRLLVVLCCLAVVGLAVLGGAEAAKNNDDDDNNLGLMAKACANYCSSSINGLDLWISLEEVCTESVAAQPYFLGSVLGDNSGSSTMTGYWSPVTAGVVCGALWAVGIFAGFRSGSKVGSKYKGQYPVA